MKRWQRILAAVLGVVALLAGIFASTWSYWLEDYAERKAMAVLSSKFKEVEHGGFELTNNQVIITELYMSNPGAAIHIKELVVDYTPDFWNKKAVIHDIKLEGGRVEGELEEFKKLKGPDKPKKKRSSRVDLSSTQVSVKELDVDVTARGLRARGTVSTTAPIRGPFPLHLSSSSISREEDVLASAELLETTLDPKELFPLEVSVEGLSSELDELHIKDVIGTVGVKDEGINELEFDLRGKTDEGQTWSFDGNVDRSKDLAQGHLVADGISPAQLPVDQLPLDPELGTLSVDLEVHRNKNLVTARGSANVKEFHVSHPKLARDTVIIGGELEVQAKADLSTRELVVEELKVRPRVGDHLSTVEFTSQARVLYTEDPQQREFELELHMDSNPCQEVLEAMPPGFLPALEEFELGGEATVDFHVLVKMHDHKATELEGGLELSKCKLKKVPKELEDLKGPFIHLVKMKTGQIAQRPVIPGHFYYVPFSDMPSSVPGAVLSTEDGGFWKHKGWRRSAFLESLQRNVQLGTFRRGASTLSMQMVKNVLLTHEKTVSRKVQEVFLTWAVEKMLTKQRILEIYLNVVEFGPGIYGVGHAADHYFGKEVSQLNSLEAAFMATLLPRPLERHAMWCRGEMTPKHAKYVGKVHRRMLAKGRITQEDFDQAELEGVVFSRAAWSGLKSCLAEGEAMRKGKHTQGAVSGLLYDVEAYP